MTSMAAGGRIHSMTGFARARTQTSMGEAIVSLRAVNHRALDLHFHLPASFDFLEGKMRKRIAECVRRGHVDVRLSFQSSGPSGAPAQWNRSLLETWLAAFREATERYGLKCEPDLNAALRIPGMLSVAEAEEVPLEVEEAILGALDGALEQLNSVRAQEGAAIAAALREIGTGIHAAAREIERVRAGVTAAIQSRLAERISELLQGVALDPQRIAQEAAVLADRSDISEETTRLKIHVARLDELLSAGGEIGKKIEFLLQEMHREVNTILSKSNAAGEAGRELTRIALEMKSGVEKIREQSLNLE
jgi:uncharacterized protein (TIGR00255 family)